MKTERAKPVGVVSFGESAKLSGIGNTNHVDGYVKKYGTAPFTFPVGHGGFYRPFSTSADGTFGAYFKANPGTATLPDGAPFAVASKDSEITKVSAKEYWDVNGSKPTKLTLTYNAVSDVTGLTGSTLSKLSIVGWNASTGKWTVISSTADEVALLGGTSTLTSGSITTTQTIIPDAFSVYTLGSLATSTVASAFEGNVESSDCSEIVGWVWDKSYPESVATVELLEGTIVRATVSANEYREDLKNAGTGTGKYGFRMTLPAILKDGKTRSLSLRVRGSSYILSNSPVVVTCSYAGSFASTDCYTAKGWVWNKDKPGESLTVELVEGGAAHASALANVYDASLKSQGIGTGYYAFTLNIPTNLKTGQPRDIAVRVKGSNYTLTGSTKTINCLSPLYNGKLEAMDCSTVQGWVWDKNNPNDLLTVELFEGNVVYATASASIFRDDLLSAGTGTGKYGFSFPTPAILKDGQEHQLSVRVKGTGVILTNTPRAFTCAVPIQYTGVFESIDCDSVRGYAWDKSYPDKVLTVELLEGSTVVASSAASAYRADLKDKGFGTGKYGFSFALPAVLKDGQPHELTMRVRSSTTVLSGGPKTVNCQYGGVLEVVDCNTIKGYALNKDLQDKAVEVEILENNAVRMTMTANQLRSDLSAVGNGSGKYGFSQAFPMSFKDGKAHTFSARIKGTNYYLTDSPKSVTCALPSAYAGVFEGLDCDVARGYVWDKNYPDQAVTVELLEGTSVRASAIASTYRQDVKDQGFGTGNYGFSIPLPASLKDGKAHQLSIRVKSTSILLTDSPKSVTCTALSTYAGMIEGLDCSTVRGYAWDKSYPDKAVVVELVEGSTVYATATASTYREDLFTAGTGTGKYGFSFALPTALKDGQEHQLSIRVKGSTTLLKNSPRAFTCAVPIQYTGVFESIDCDSVRGYAWDKSYPDKVLTVELLEGSTVVASSAASAYRADLKDKGFGTGKYGFSFALPAVLKDGQPHELTMRVRSSTTVLSGGPKTVNCQYGGVLEVVDCNTIKGYALNKDLQDKAVEVEILENNAVRMTMTANQLRSDLSAVGNGSGKYGFSQAFPMSFKDGKAHTFSARIKGTNYYLTDSPKSVTCALPSAYAGVFEGLDCDVARGYVWDKNYPDQAVTVELLEGTSVRASAIASTYRQDVKDQGFGTGNYGFSIPLPASLKDGKAHQLSIRVKSTSILLTDSPKSVTCTALSTYAGMIEGLDCSTVRGYAWDKSYPDKAVVVELVEGSTVYATATASTYREDLFTAGTGTGKYGFSFALPTALKDGQEHQLSIRVKGSTTLLKNSPRAFTCAVPIQYTGVFESIDCDSVRGYAWDKSYPDKVLTVELLEGSTVVASSAASAYRADLKDKGFGTGKYGFSFALPAVLKDGQPHELTMRVRSSTTVLSGGPKTVNCQYGGVLEVVDCNTIKGYALNKDLQDKAVEVEILENNAVRMTMTANQLRSDLSAVGNGSGKYGFSQAFPMSFKDGKAHTFSARIKGTNYYLTDSPKSVTCALPSAYAGVFEGLDCDVARGYVWDKNYPDQAVTVELLEGTSVRASAIASTYRQDVKDQGFGTGNYGFSIPLPASLKDGKAHQLSIRVKSTSILLTDSPKSVTCTALSTYAGMIEGLDCSTVRGYAWDKSYPDKAVVVELVEGSTVYATATASTYREDLFTAGTGTGKYGFSFALPTALKDGQEHQLSIRVKGSTTLLKNSPRAFTCAVPIQYTGVFESIDCDSVRGYAWDKSYPDKVLTVELLEGSTVVASSAASAYRADLKDKGFGTGKYGFSFALPAVLKDGQPHELTMRVRSSTTVLSGGPKTVNCQYGGVLEVVDCNTIKGYALNKDLPDIPVIVEIMEGKSVRMSLTANVGRTDLPGIGNNSGKYGFTKAYPASWKDGQPHTLSARIKGTNFYLGDAKTATCQSSSARIALEEKPNVELSADETNMEVIVAPNPTTGKFWIEFTPTQLSDAVVFVSGQNGIVTSTEKLITTIGQRMRHEVDLSANPSGAYIIQLRYDGLKVETKKVVLVK